MHLDKPLDVSITCRTKPSTDYQRRSPEAPRHVSYQGKDFHSEWQAALTTESIQNCIGFRQDTS